MSRKIPWPFVVVVVSSFLLGAAWGWKLIQDRAIASGRLATDAKLRILAPPGIFSRELLSEFQKQTRIAVDVTTETFPSSLLRRALKAAPGQFDMALVYHHQVSALRSERKLANLWDSRSKFPVVIAPDFRKLPDDRNLMETAPVFWGLLGIVNVPNLPGSYKWAVWPSFVIGLNDTSETTAAFAAKAQLHMGPLDDFEKNLQQSPTGSISKLSKTTFQAPHMISHASLEFSPLKELKKELKLEFQGLPSNSESNSESSQKYSLWIMTLAAVADGDLENSRRFVRFLIEPENNIALVGFAKVGASTLRASESLKALPETLVASYFRKFPIDQISVERDDRVRQADDILEQIIRGAEVPLSAAKPVVKTLAKPVANPVANPSAKHIPPPTALEEVPKPKVKAAKVAPPSKPAKETSTEPATESAVMNSSSSADAAPVEAAKEVAPEGPNAPSSEGPQSQEESGDF